VEPNMRILHYQMVEPPYVTQNDVHDVV
jgi:hypothetical protein